MNIFLKLILTVLTFQLLGCSTFKKLPMPSGVKQSADPYRFHWIKEYDPDYETGNLPIALQSPLIYEGIVYSGDADGIMRAFDVESGRVIWETRDNGTYHAGPIGHKDMIIYGTNEGRVYARHALTGEQIYAVDLGASIESSGVIYRDRLFFHTRNHKIFSLDLKSGKILWAYKRSVALLTTIQRVSQPLLYENKLIVGFADGYVVAFQVDEGVLLWEQSLGDSSKFIDVDMSPVLFKGQLLVGSVGGGLYTLDVKSGAVLRKFDYNVSRSPYVENGAIYLTTTSGEFVALDNKYFEKKRVKLGHASLGQVHRWKDYFVLGTVEGHLYFLRPESLRVVGHYHLGHSTSAIHGDMTFEDNTMAFISSRHRLYVLR